MSWLSNMGATVSASKLVGNELTVDMVDGKQYSGLLYCIDPVTQNVVLIDTNTNMVSVLMATSIKHVHSVTGGRTDVQGK